MKLRHLAWIVVPVLVGAASYATRSEDFRRHWMGWLGSEPVIECPQTIELGVREVGEIAVARFVMANHGGSDLVIDQLATNCACSGLEREENGQLVRIEELRLKPREQVNLAMRLSIRGQPGRPMRNGVSFHTNDPTRPAVTIEVVVSKVRAGVHAAPASVVFGTVPVGAKVRNVFKVRDGAVDPRAIEQITSTNPGRFTARLLPVVPGEVATAEGESSSVIGRVEVILETKEPGPVSGEIRIDLRGEARRPVVVAVSGRVANLVEARPPSLMLPRNSGTGPVFFGTCLCRSTEGKPLTLTVISTPPGVTASVSAIAGDPAAQMVRIDWEPASADPRPAPPGDSVRLSARIGGQEEPLEIPVNCRRE